MQQGLSFSYLDFEGRPTFTIENLDDMEPDRMIDIEYELDNLSIMKKPLLVFGTFFSLMLIVIALNRIKLEAFEEKRE